MDSSAEPGKHRPYWRYLTYNDIKIKPIEYDLLQLKIINNEQRFFKNLDHKTLARKKDNDSFEVNRKSKFIQVLISFDTLVCILS